MLCLNIVCGYQAVAAALPEAPQRAVVAPAHREGAPGGEEWRARARAPSTRCSRPRASRMEPQPRARPACLGEEGSGFYYNVLQTNPFTI